MKKNLIFIVVDSVTDESTSAQNYRKSPMPFLDSLREKSFQARNVYSQAPFTEAALMPLLTGNDLLDKGGYLCKFKYRDVFLKYMQDNGYKTYINHLHPLIYPTYCFNGVSETKYDSFYCLEQMWGYRLKHYAPYYLENTLSKAEMDFIYDIVDDNLTYAISQLHQYLDDTFEVEILRSHTNIDIEARLKELEYEYDLYCKDKNQYVDELMHQGLDFHLFKLPELEVNRKVSEEFVDQFIDRYKPTFDRIYNLNKKMNFKNLKFPLKKIVSSLAQGQTFDAKQYLAMYKNAVYDKDLYDRVSKQYPDFKAAISMRSHFKDAVEWIEKQDGSQPYAIYLHVDDVHSPEFFFSIDCEDTTILDEEFKNLEDYMDNLPSNYYGNLASDLSLVYCDNCLKYLFDELEKKGILDNTVVAITADHGFSFSYRPIRTVYVNSEFTENYHIPFVLYDKDRSPETNNGYFSSKDIVPTMLSSVNLEIPNTMSGISMIDTKGRNHATVEYMGGGCPDMERRDVVLGAHTDDYLVIVKHPLTKDFVDYNLDQVYDLKKDPIQYRNLNKKIDRSLIAKELKIIEDRFKELKADYEEFKREQN